MLPPCRDTLTNKIRRANMVSLIWGRANQKNPSQDLDPCEFGWKTDDSGKYAPLWSSGPVLPSVMATTSSETDSENHEEALDQDMIDDHEPEWSGDSSDDEI